MSSPPVTADCGHKWSRILSQLLVRVMGCLLDMQA